MVGPACLSMQEANWASGPWEGHVVCGSQVGYGPLGAIWGPQGAGLGLELWG